MKQVKRLCYDKLKSMDTDEVKKTIQPPVSEWDGGVDATLMDLLEYKAPSQTTPDPREGEEQQPVDHIPESSSPPKAASESGMKDFMIQISDVSGDEGSMETSTQKVDQAQSSPTVPSCGTNRTEERCATVDSDCRQEEVLSESSATEECWVSGGYAVNVPEAAHLLEMELRRRALESELKRTNSQQMQHGDNKAPERAGLQRKQISDDKAPERTGLQRKQISDDKAPERAGLQRKQISDDKAPERTGLQRKQISDDKAPERAGLQRKQISEDMDRGTEEDVSSEVGSAVRGCVESGGTVDEGGRMLELKLRERALQSMLARRERSSL